jgi:hypothetical protein
MDRLRPLPSTFQETVAALHRVAERIVSPARKPDREISLEATPGGFGTPVFEHEGRPHQVRVDGAELVFRSGDGERRAALTSLAAAARLVADLLPADAAGDDAAIAIDPAAATALADWYGFGASVLGEFVAGAASEPASSPVRLWPEHFDIAIELGSEQLGERANYGLSPGDEQHPEPYVYVGPWTAEPAGELWQATGFRGAELTYAELLAAADQRGAALEFFRARRNGLTATARSEV